MVDLHTHTTFSDGTWSVEKLLEVAEEEKVTTLAITDHDTALPHIKLKNMEKEKYFSGRIIVGGEFNAIFNGTKIELLGYNFDPEELQKWIDKAYDKNREEQGYEEEFEELLQLCKKNNIRTTEELKYDAKIKWPTKIIYDDIVKYPENRKFFTDAEWNERQGFFRSCTCNPNFILYRSFEKQYPDAKEVVRTNKKGRRKSVFSTFIFVFIR